MRRFGIWLMLIGFGVPFLITAISMSIAFNMETAVDQGKFIQRTTSIALNITAVFLPIALIGVACWLIGVVHQANLYRQSQRPR